MESEELIKLEQFIGDEIPHSLKIILQMSGFDLLLNLKYITSEKIDSLEQFMQMKKENFHSKLDGIHDMAAIEYKKQERFEFLPGHRDVLLKMPKFIKDMHFVNNGNTKNPAKNDLPKVESSVEYSHILTQMINVANMNKNKPKQAKLYTDVIKYFSTYIFLQCGRACYETLSSNLPMPSTKTICEYDTWITSRYILTNVVVIRRTKV